MNCKICNKTFHSIKGLSSHIRQSHKISSEQYYIQYINKIHTCKMCKNNTAFIDLSNGFRKYCSAECANNDSDRTDLARNTFRSNTTNVERARQRMIAYNQSELGRHNSSKVGHKTGSANLCKAHKKYDSIRYCEICKSNTKHIIGIGCLTCYNQNETHKQSIVKSIQTNYGSNYTNVYQLPDIKAKIIQTSMAKYGITNPGNTRDARIKASITMHANGNYSHDEDYFAEQLDKLGIKYITQYKSELYPFLCDFYLTDLDMYIELNIYWSHNTHFFDNTSKDDLDILYKWQEKAKSGHKQYINAINVWTNKDLLKRETAIRNKLNYIVLWSRHDIDLFIQNTEQLVEIRGTDNDM